jgi:hypothetical protein
VALGETGRAERQRVSGGGRSREDEAEEDGEEEAHAANVGTVTRNRVKGSRTTKGSDPFVVTPPRAAPPE